MKRTVTVIAALLTSALLSAQVPPSCARTDSSFLRLPRSHERIDKFRSKLKACADSAHCSVTIWQIGGSHVQAGYFSTRIRHNFDSLGHYPTGNRAYVFPYPLAHTNYDRSYHSEGFGEWIGSRSCLPNRKMPARPAWGITGIAAYTADTSASFSFGMPQKYSRLHIMGEASPDVLPRVCYGKDTLACKNDSLLQGFVVNFPIPVDTVSILPSIRNGEFFIITGLLPESPEIHGVNYISTGVNGARTGTWTERCPQFERELGMITPDLVILGLGINDSACPAKDFRPERFKANYRKLIDMILRRSPDCALVFVTNNDSWRYSGRRMVHNDNGRAVEQAIFELAAEYDGAVWDLFEIMGGNGSASAWREAGLMKKDRLHFTKEGYQLLGDMLYKAITE
ncbi:MAG: hypothetical protein IJU68_05330 [Bacteroidales bacterium]|nr:hypothetical protein [Bacteroidales bacterium]